MNNPNLAKMVNNARSTAVEYVSKIKNPVLSRSGVLPVVLLDTAGYLIEGPLNAYQNLGWTIISAIQCLFFQNKASTIKIVSHAEGTLISLTNIAAKGITAIPLALCHAAEGLLHPEELTTVGRLKERESFSNFRAKKIVRKIDIFFNQQLAFKGLFSKDSTFTEIVKRPAAVLFVIVDRLARIAMIGLAAIIVALRSIDGVTFCFKQGRISVKEALVRFTAALHLAGACASKIVTSPFYLAHHSVINLLMPPKTGYSA